MQTVAFGKYSALLVILLSITVGAQRTFDRCSLARAMDRLGVPRNQLAQWACIAEHESSYRTWVVGSANSDGSKDHGIFQINDRYWCDPRNGEKSLNICKVDCAALRTDHIDQAVKCAQKVLKKDHNNWAAWSVYNIHCNGYLPSIEDCFGSGSHSMVGAGVCGKW